MLLKKEKETVEIIDMPNQKNIKTLEEKENYKCLGILEMDTIKQMGMNEELKKESLRRTRKLLRRKQDVTQNQSWF